VPSPLRRGTIGGHSFRYRNSPANLMQFRLEFARLTRRCDAVYTMARQAPTVRVWHGLCKTIL
jgi:hypothetical protein